MPDNYSANLRVFPAKEMMAVDMAYALDSLAFGSGIVHGCLVANTNGVLTITSGRIMIKGRLAYIQGGNIPLPSDSGTYYLLAICNLLAPEPFELRLCSSQEKQDLDALVANTIDTEFNSADGVRYLQLGTAVVDAALGVVTSYTPNASSSTPRNNATIYDAKMADIARDFGDHQSHLSWLDNRRWKAAKLVRDEIKYPSLTIPANSRARATVNIAYGSRYTATASGGTVSIHNTPGTDTGSVPSTPDAYGRNTSLNQNHKVLAITGIILSNADVGGGANATKCVLAGFNRTSAATDYQHHTALIDVYNLASSAAVIDVNVHVLYALME